MNRMRLIRGVGALAALLLLLAGVPLALIALSGNPLPDEVSWETTRRALLRPDDGALVVRLIAVVGWIAWLVFAISTVAEVIELVSSHRISLRLPGLAGPQRMVAGLMLSVVAMAGTLADRPGRSGARHTCRASGRIRRQGGWAVHITARVGRARPRPRPPGGERR